MLCTTHRLPIPIPQRLEHPPDKGYQREPNRDPDQDRIVRPRLGAQPDILSILIRLGGSDPRPDGGKDTGDKDEEEGNAGEDGVDDERWSFLAVEEEDGEQGGEHGETGQSDVDDEDDGEGFDDAVERVEGALDFVVEADVFEGELEGTDAEFLVEDVGYVEACMSSVSICWQILE